jgi:hypothetical protein
MSNPATMEGQTVRARVLGADRIPDGEWALDVTDRPVAVTQIGTLTVTRVDSLDYTQYVVNGVPVDPDSIAPVDLPGRLYLV